MSKIRVTYKDQHGVEHTCDVPLRDGIAEIAFPGRIERIVCASCICKSAEEPFEGGCPCVCHPDDVPTKRQETPEASSVEFRAGVRAGIAEASAHDAKFPPLDDDTKEALRLLDEARGDAGETRAASVRRLLGRQFATSGFVPSHHEWCERALAENAKLRENIELIKDEIPFATDDESAIDAVRRAFADGIDGGRRASRARSFVASVAALPCVHGRKREDGPCPRFKTPPGTAIGNDAFVHNECAPCSARTLMADEEREAPEIRGLDAWIPNDDASAMIVERNGPPSCGCSGMFHKCGMTIGVAKKLNALAELDKALTARPDHHPRPLLTGDIGKKPR